MPIIDVTCAQEVTHATKRRLAADLPHLVSLAVACEAEPYDGDLRPGDVLIRFRDAGPLDRFDVDVLIEVHSKWFEDRARDRQDRADAIRDGVLDLVPDASVVGVYLRLPVAAWAQTD